MPAAKKTRVPTITQAKFIEEQLTASQIPPILYTLTKARGAAKKSGKSFFKPSADSEVELTIADLKAGYRGLRDQFSRNASVKIVKSRPAQLGKAPAKRTPSFNVPVYVGNALRNFIKAYASPSQKRDPIVKNIIDNGTGLSSDVVGVVRGIFSQPEHKNGSKIDFYTFDGLEDFG